MLQSNVKIISTHTNLMGITTTVYQHNNFHALNAHVERHQNDIYGNPLYKVRITGGDYELTYQFPQAYRRYRSKGYSLVQSYNIEQEVGNILAYLQSFEFRGLVIVPHFQLNAFDELSYEFSICTQRGEYLTDEQDGQDYDTFRIFNDGTTKGTLSQDYYVYDEVALPGELPLYKEELYKAIQSFAKRVYLDDQTNFALNNFKKDGWEE